MKDRSGVLEVRAGGKNLTRWGTIKEFGGWNSSISNSGGGSKLKTV